jgi:hypothetical protein
MRERTGHVSSIKKMLNAAEGYPQYYFSSFSLFFGNSATTRIFPFFAARAQGDIQHTSGGYQVDRRAQYIIVVCIAI